MSVSAIEIQPLQGPIDARVSVPGSKSYTNRALLVAALAQGHSQLNGALFSDDTHYMTEALRELGIAVEADRDACRFEVEGKGGQIPQSAAELYIGNAGTAARSLVSCTALGKGTYLIDGDGPMRQSRPIDDLLEALGQLGVKARSKNNNGCLPVIVEGRGIRGGKTQLDTTKSSQFLTSLMLVGPYTQEGLDIEITGALKRQYIDITMAVMKAFGAELTHQDYRRFSIPGGQVYQPCTYTIEPDASSASYFFAAAALCGGRVQVGHLRRDSAQGDLRFVEVLKNMGCVVNYKDEGVEVIGPQKLAGIDVDVKEVSDTALTLAAIAPFAQTSVTLRNIEHIRWQETDRIAAMVTELRKLGVEVEERRDGVTILPSGITPAAIDTYEDHRVAMSFALIGLKVGGIRINDPDCVSKTFPSYFSALDQLRP